MTEQDIQEAMPEFEDLLMMDDYQIFRAGIQAHADYMMICYPHFEDAGDFYRACEVKE